MLTRFFSTRERSASARGALRRDAAAMPLPRAFLAALLLVLPIQASADAPGNGRSHIVAYHARHDHGAEISLSTSARITLTAVADARRDLPSDSVTFRSGNTVLGTAPLVPIGAGSLSSYGNGVTSCAITLEGGAACWGRGNVGQLGNGGTADSAVPVAVQGLPGFVVQLATNYSHSCALLIDGSVWCWGSNAFGQLGNGTTTNALTPVAPVGIPDPVVSIATGSQHTCVVTDADDVYCWGLNEYGQLGDGTQTQRLTPVQVAGLDDDVVQLTLGDWTSCARTAAGTAQCWGRNDSGFLGTGTTSAYEATPQSVSYAGTIVDIDASREGTCFVNSAGQVYCMGRNNYGQMGLGSASSGSFAVPQLVNGTSDIEQVSYGARHVCARANDGSVSCWGTNSSGELGLGSADGSVHTVAPVSLGEPVWQVSAGARFNCGLTLDGGVLCWGGNNVGQIGNDQLGVDQPLPVAVDGGAFALPQADAIARLTIDFYPGRDNGLRASFDTGHGWHHWRHH